MSELRLLCQTHARRYATLRDATRRDSSSMFRATPLVQAALIAAVLASECPRKDERACKTPAEVHFNAEMKVRSHICKLSCCISTLK